MVVSRLGDMETSTAQAALRLEPVVGGNARPRVTRSHHKQRLCRCGGRISDHREALPCMHHRLSASLARSSYFQPARLLEVVASMTTPVRRRLPLDLLEPRSRPASPLGKPERERGRVVLLWDAALLDVAVEVG